MDIILKISAGFQWSWAGQALHVQNQFLLRSFKTYWGHCNVTFCFDLFFFFGLCGNLKLFKGIVHLSFTLIYSPSCHSMRYKLLSFCVFGVFFPLGAWQLWTLWTVIICQEPCAFMHRKNNSLWVWIDTRASKWCADISKKQYRQKILLNIFASICYFFFHLLCWWRSNNFQDHYGYCYEADCFQKHHCSCNHAKYIHPNIHLTLG